MKEGTNNIPHGIGIQVRSQGVMVEGYWQDGVQHGKGRGIFGDTYHTGEYKEMIRYGQGTYYYEDGNTYIGEWDNEAGKGEIRYKDGTRYTGSWDWFKRNGVGTLFSADRQVINSGKWSDDDYLGPE